MCDSKTGIQALNKYCQALPWSYQTRPVLNHCNDNTDQVY